MSQEQLIKLANEAGFPEWWTGPFNQQREGGMALDVLKRFAALVEAAAESEDGAILDAMDARPHDCRGLDKTPQGWRVIPKGKLTHVLYKDLRSAMKSGLGIGGQS